MTQADTGPLARKRVLVTRTLEQSEGTAALLRAAGAEPWIVPAIRIEPAADRTPLLRAVRDVRAGAYPWVVFTSALGVEHTWDAVAGQGGDASWFVGTRIAVVGPATGKAVEAHGLRAELTATETRSEGLADAVIEELAGEVSRVLLPQAAKARRVLPDRLREAGCWVDVVVAYETLPARGEAMASVAVELDAGRVDAVLFTSGSTVTHLCEALGPAAPALLARARVASIGPVTSEALRGRGVQVDVEAREASIPGLVHVLAESYAKPVP